jgi:glycosyltransferase involved in cell wall biosynthesis
VIGGTRDLAGLLRVRRRGIPIVQRLDGMNWLHKRIGLAKTGWRHYMRAEYGNLLLALIRNRLADRIVYQSEFSRAWWDRIYGKKSADQRVIYNGVDLEIFNPIGEGSPPTDIWRVLMVEGSLMGGYEQGISVAIDAVRALAERLATEISPGSRRIVELAVAGKVDQAVKSRWDQAILSEDSRNLMRLHWHGLLSHSQIPIIDRSAHLLYSSDINPACPNSVIEALACGLPVAAFATGALPEMIKDGAGGLVSYGGDPWKLDPPDTASLADSMLNLLLNQNHHRRAARMRAEAAFGLELMVESYLEMLSA